MPAEKPFKTPPPPDLPTETAKLDNDFRMGEQETLSSSDSQPVSVGVASHAAGSTWSMPPNGGVSGSEPPSLNSININAMTMNSSCNLFGTPRRKTAQRDFKNDRSVKGQGKSIMSTLDGVVPYFKFQSLQKLSQNAVGESMDVEKWVASNPTLFDQDTSRWAKIDESPGLERNLYMPFVNLIGRILDHYLTPVEGVRRKVADTHSTQMKHQEGHHTSPDIIVQGTGPSFATPLDEKNLGYGNIVTFFEIKLDTAMKKPENLEQTSVYARQVFIHQPNRWFVRGLILSQNNVRLVHWDRGGLQKSHRFNIHGHPEVFVGLIVSLSNTEGEQENIGLDKSIEWCHDKAGNKVSGNMTDVSDDPKKVFEIEDAEPISFDLHIHGSGTVWWSVIDPTPKVPTQRNLLVKDSWSSPGRTEEWKLLERAAKNKIKGICKMLFHKDRRAQISNFRDGDMFFDRSLSRLVTEAYGGSLEGFKCASQVLSALRDAVAAHGNLYGIGILHRDISHRTILLGREGAEIGEQGILIDLGVAFDFYRDADSKISKEPIMGPRFYQSSMILSFLTGSDDDKDVPFAPAHDYLDDIESFFGVLCHTLFGFYPTGLKRPIEDKGHNYVKGWDDVCPRISLGAKNLLITPSLRERELAMDHIAETWGPACETLFDEFSTWLFSIHMRKAKLVRGYKKTIRKLLENSSAPTKGSSAEGSNLNVEESEVEGSKVGGPNVEGSSVGRSNVEGSNVEWPNVEESTVETPNIEAPSASGSSVEGPSIQGSGPSETTAKEPVAQENQEEYHKSVFAPLYSDAESHYQHIVNILHKAVAALETCPAKPPPPVSIPNPTFVKKADKGKGVKRQLSFNDDEDTQSNKVNKISEECGRTRRMSTRVSAPRPQVQGSVTSDTSMDTTA